MMQWWVLIYLFSYSVIQEKKRNNIKDFLNVAGPMGVTHFLILSKTHTAPFLRVAKTPQGPTLTFKIHEYSLTVDVAQSQLRPRCPQDLFKNSPLVSLYYLIFFSLSSLRFFDVYNPKTGPCNTVASLLTD